MRQYNPDVDKYYSPDDTPDLYLSDEQVKEYIGKISIEKEESEFEVRHLIVEIESLNRFAKMGEISNEENYIQSKKLADSFLQKFGFWPYVTKTYELFYKNFIR